MLFSSSATAFTAWPWASHFPRICAPHLTVSPSAEHRGWKPGNYSPQVTLRRRSRSWNRRRGEEVGSGGFPHLQVIKISLTLIQPPARGRISLHTFPVFLLYGLNRRRSRQLRLARLKRTQQPGWPSPPGLPPPQPEPSRRPQPGCARRRRYLQHPPGGKLTGGLEPPAISGWEATSTPGSRSPQHPRGKGANWGGGAALRSPPRGRAAPAAAVALPARGRLPPALPPARLAPPANAGRGEEPALTICCEAPPPSAAASLAGGLPPKHPAEEVGSQEKALAPPPPPPQELSALRALRGRRRYPPPLPHSLQDRRPPPPQGWRPSPQRSPLRTLYPFPPQHPSSPSLAGGRLPASPAAAVGWWTRSTAGGALRALRRHPRQPPC